MATLNSARSCQLCRKLSACTWYRNITKFTKKNLKNCKWNDWLASSPYKKQDKTLPSF